MENLTKREITILKLIRQGYENYEIGQIIFVSIHTVKAHISTIMRKLNARNRANAVYIAMINHMLDD